MGPIEKIHQAWRGKIDKREHDIGFIINILYRADVMERYTDELLLLEMARKYLNKRISLIEGCRLEEGIREEVKLLNEYRKETRDE